MGKGFATFVVFLVLAQASLPVFAQSPVKSSDHQQTLPASSTELPQNTGSQAAKPDCIGDSCGYPQPRITVANPAPTVSAPWILRDQITWAANLVLVVLGYVGIMLAISTLRKIKNQLGTLESVATAAADTAQAALRNVEAMLHAERPWILITVEPSPTALNSFIVVATNRGRSPAKITSLVEQIKIASDEAHLPRNPEYENEKPDASRTPVILLPGEFLRIKNFSREDVKAVCSSKDTLQRVENWEEKIFIHGKILYRDLIASTGRDSYETAWCCWYIHGRQRSGLVIGGPDEYNQHT